MPGPEAGQHPLVALCQEVQLKRHLDEQMHSAWKRGLFHLSHLSSAVHWLMSTAAIRTGFARIVKPAAHSASKDHTKQAEVLLACLSVFIWYTRKSKLQNLISGWILFPRCYDIRGVRGEWRVILHAVIGMRGVTSIQSAPASLSDVSKGSHRFCHISIPMLPPLPHIAVYCTAVTWCISVYQPKARQ